MITKNQIKFIKSLSLKKNRIKEQLFIAEGEKVVSELLRSDFEIKNIYATKEWKVSNDNITQISNAELQRISNLKSPNKVLAVVQFKIHKIIKHDGITLVLDDINDPGNLGTIIRMCDWFGVKQIICSKNTVDIFNPKVVQSAMGSAFRVQVNYTDLENYLSEIKTPIYGAFMDGKNLKEVKLPKSAHLVLGNEANGISAEINKLITDKVAIKNIGNSAESLNVAVATSILLHVFCD
ncbi:MAG: RNA methyltransferase [Flavobacteriales bacterium]|mgnify:FL=1|nr:RNA methyltransferase [Flavobacteriales bacterium]MBT5273300.1 RNA methyltransferase [Flavobacteriales bacterium]MBT5615458.1 RNA methyltransferase [Flavobacteriales bacterium]MBT6965330.1 RNA methyltransferase [Flavobacteriales bacterium]